MFMLFFDEHGFAVLDVDASGGVEHGASVEVVELSVALWVDSGVVDAGGGVVEFQAEGCAGERAHVVGLVLGQGAHGITAFLLLCQRVEFGSGVAFLLRQENELVTTKTVNRQAARPGKDGQS